jgi:hypothetical protein
MNSTGAKGLTQTNKKIQVRVQKIGAKETEENTGLAHRTIRCTKGDRFKLFTFGFLERRSAIIHRTVRRASEATAIEHNGQLQRSLPNATVRNSARQSQSTPDTEQ